MKLHTATETYDLDPHQHVALEFLRDNDRCALFLEMALQKTVTVLLRLDELLLTGEANRVLIVAPEKVARLTWVDELNKWTNLKGIRYSLVMGTPAKRLKALEADADIYIVGIDCLVWLLDLYVKQRVSRNGIAYGKYEGSLPFDTLVIDESSTLKNNGSKRFKSLRRALDRSKLERVYLMSGTPSPNGLQDLWSQLYIVDGGHRLGDTYTGYIHQFFNAEGNGMITFNLRPKTGAKEEILRRIADVTLTMKTDDHVKLPPLRIFDEWVELDPFDKEMYDILEREYVLDLDSASVEALTGADLSNKLLQIASGAIYDENRDWHEVNTAKLERLGKLLDRHPEPVLIVYQYRHEIDRIVETYPDITVMPEGAQVRKVFEAWNRGEVKRLLIHPASAGHGLNLQYGGSTLIWYSPTWNLEHWEQTNARLKRRGSKAKFIRVYRILARNTYDVKVSTRVASKETNQKFVFKAIKQLREKYGKDQ